jgi:thiol-disulfide isomerase/thioredoxin
MAKYKKLIILLSLFQLIYVQARAQGIKINERIPDVFIPEVYRYGKNSLHLRSEFEGKPLIIDFWFTYCSSCIGLMPKLDSLHKKYKDQFNVLLSNFEKKEVIERFLTNKKKLEQVGLPSTSSDTLLLKLFPHIYSPHEVWIDKNGIVVAITGDEAITEENIIKLINGQSLHLPVKMDIDYTSNDSSSPFTDNNNIINSQYSYVGDYLKDRGGETLRRIKNGFTNIKKINATVPELYELAYQQEDLKPSQYIYQNIDSTIYTTNSQTGKNRFCYEMRLKDTIWSNAYLYMQQDLDRYFKIRSELKSEPTLCYIISHVSPNADIDTSKSKGFPDWYAEGANYVFKYAPWQAVMVYLNETLPYPLIDETGNSLKKRLKMLEIPLNWGNLEVINKRLSSYNLKIKQEVRNVNHIVFSNQNRNNDVTKH